MNKKNIRKELEIEFPAFITAAIEQQSELKSARHALIKSHESLKMLMRDQRRSAKIRMNRMQFVIGGSTTSQLDKWMKDGYWVWMITGRDRFRIGHKNTNITMARHNVRRFKRAFKYVVS